MEEHLQLLVNISGILAVQNRMLRGRCRAASIAESGPCHGAGWSRKDKGTSISYRKTRRQGEHFGKAP